ncbi:hypothetical protein [Liberibacter crescens]|nr:hypothetical protein [Liberibacter crescens]
MIVLVQKILMTIMMKAMAILGHIDHSVALVDNIILFKIAIIQSSSITNYTA